MNAVNSDKLTNNPLASALLSSFTSELRGYANDQLPEVMIPSHFVVLDELPKLPNGKVDRNQLPAVQLDEVDETKYVAPRNTDEEKISQIWSELLGVLRVSVEESFFDLGGDSLSAVKMATKVREEYGVAISMRNLFKNPTVASMTKMIGNKNQRTVLSEKLINLTDKELLQEAQLPEDIKPDEDALPAVTTAYKKILLTGGTGYTGAYLLRELLERSEAIVYVLVRAKDPEHAIERLRKNMQQYGIWDEAYKSRIIGIVSDVGHPYFSVTHSVYKELSENVEMIIHNAALSSYAMPYRQLKPINVLGTLEVLRLACRHRIKPVHYISSLAVFQGHPGVHHHKERKLTEPNGLVGGYRQSKWVGDRLVTLAGERGLPFNVYRPGLITGAQDSGACSPETYLNAAMKSCIQLKMALDFDVMLEINPVDFCAKSVVYIALGAKDHGKHFHLAGAYPVRWNCFTDMLREYGYQLKRVPYITWYTGLITALENGIDNALSKFLPLFGEEAPTADTGDEGCRPQYDATCLHQALKGSGIQCAPLDQDLITTYLDYFVSTGYLPEPGEENV